MFVTVSVALYGGPVTYHNLDVSSSFRFDLEHVLDTFHWF